MNLPSRASVWRGLILAGLAWFHGSALAQRPLGVDVSHYQGSINWVSVAGSGITFAWAKATEGATSGGDDATFTANAANAKAAGIPIGAYHFAHSELNTPASEAAHFWAVAGPNIKGDGKSLMPMLDIEASSVSGHVGASSVSDWCNQWCNAVSNSAYAVGLIIKPVIYVSACNASAFDNSI